MDISINWDSNDFNKIIDNKLKDLLSNLKKQEYFENINVDIFQRKNARHVIDVKIKTKNPNEFLTTSGISCNYDTSLYDLTNKLSSLINKYDPNEYQRKIDLEQKKLKQEELKKQEIKDKIEKKKQLQEQKQEKIKKEQEEKRLKKLEENNKKLAELSKKRELQEEKLEKEIQDELNKRLAEINELNKQNEEKLNDAINQINSSSETVNNDLNEDNKVQTELKESKDKLRNLWSQENECLVIIDKIKDWNSRVFSDKYYKPNEPFQLVDGKTIYHDGHENFFIANENNQWVPYSKQELEQDFEFLKAKKIEELEQKLIVARERAPKHILDLADNSEVIKKLEKSKTRLKELEKQQKEEMKAYKKSADTLTKSLDLELKQEIGDIDNIEIIEAHNANEPFTTNNDLYAYHDGEGNYYLYENDQWIPTTKDIVYKSSKKVTDKNSLEAHKPNETFLNSDNIYYYFDDNNNYYKCVNNEWVLSSYEECYNISLKNKSKKDKQQKTTKIDTSDDTSQQLQQTTSNNVQTTSNAPQQWQDENGYWWYLDENGNYYYADENGNWIPYTFSA